MAIDNKIPENVKIIKEELHIRHALEFEVDRPKQAWQWMQSTRTIPDANDWVRPEVIEAWRRCLEDHHLPLGISARWPKATTNIGPVELGQQLRHIEDLIKHLSHNFTVFLQEARVTMVLTAADGRLLYATGEKQLLSSLFINGMYDTGANWHESALGNNGIGSALMLKKPIAFQGMEHFLNVLHPYTTVGYPLQDEAGNLLAVIGLISNHHDCMNSLFAFLHLICVLVNTNLPLALDKVAQERVLEQIHFKAAKLLPPINESGLTEPMELLIQKAIKLQAHKIPILITGESGVGKDHFVNLLKQAGPRKDAPFIAINCASIPRDLIESELFGYEAGSFTGARSNGKPGKFKLADKGVLFLDEIGDMSFDLQSTLLRVLETSEFTPVGGSSPVRVDVQVVAATNVQLIDAVEAGRFRRDLYYRLNGAQIHLLPLRERPDKKQLIHHILQRELQAISGIETLEICPEVIGLLERHPWPGNIRQLINVIRTTLFTATPPYVTQQDLPLDFMTELRQYESEQAALGNPIASVAALSPETANLSLSSWELHGIKTALKEADGNISLAAKKLGITRSTLYKKIDHFRLNKTGGGLLV